MFDRSHYEDVLVVAGARARSPRRSGDGATTRSTPSSGLVEPGHDRVKCLLHISYDEQRERLLARLDDPTKQWKFNEGDIDERA